jgi:hypothetical protein
MTQHEQDAVIGRAYKELKDKKERLKALKLRASELGTAFEQLGRALLFSPERKPETVRIPLPELLNVEEIEGLFTEIRETSQAIERLEKTLN